MRLLSSGIIVYHNPDGLPDWTEVQPYVSGSFLQFVRGDLRFCRIRMAKHLYIVEGWKTYRTGQWSFGHPGMTAK